MDEVERIIHEYSGDEVIFGGYLNVDLRRNHAHTRYITERCRAHGLKFGWMNPNATPESTFVSHDLRRRSIIDHFVFSEKLFDTIVGMHVYCRVDNPSEHCPVHVDLNSETARLSVKTSNSRNKHKVAWHRVTDESRSLYREQVGAALHEMDMLSYGILSTFQCQDLMCANQLHREEIDKYCSKLINTCISIGSKVFPKTKKTPICKPMWNELVEPKKVLFGGRIWRECSKPRNGIVADIMRKTKREYHSAIRYVRRHEDELRRIRMAEYISKGSHRDLWSEVKKMKSSTPTVTTRVDDANEHDIADYFALKFNELYSSVRSDKRTLRDIEIKTNRLIVEDSMKAQQESTVSEEEVRSAVGKLKLGKSDGTHGLMSNHIVYGPECLITCIAIDC